MILTWPLQADGNTSDEDAANAVVPVENHATDASALRSSMENDDGVLVITSDDEDSIAADLIVGAGGASPGVEVAVNGNQSPHAFSPTEWSSPSSPSPKVSICKH